MMVDLKFLWTTEKSSPNWKPADFPNTVKSRRCCGASSLVEAARRGFLRVLLLGMALALPASSPAIAADHPLHLPAPLHDALEALRNGRYQQTIEASRSLQETFPGHPLPPLLAAEAGWGLIFCQTGHINSREIWSEADNKSSSFDREFFDAVDRSLAASEAWRRNPQTAALGAFYDGLAHGVRARLFTLRAAAMDSAREGKQMRSSLLEAAEKDSALNMDAAAGLGVYNYYADVLSPLIKLIRFFLRIPGGDRAKGLEQLHSASQQAVMLAPEASYELAKIYSLRENRPGDALPLFRALADQYPANAIFAFSAAVQAERIGSKELSADYHRKTMLVARQSDDVCRQRLIPASQQALDRLQGDFSR